MIITDFFKMKKEVKEVQLRRGGKSLFYSTVGSTHLNFFH